MPPVALSQLRCTGLYMNVVHAIGTVGKTRNGVEQPGADDVADLKASMIVAVTECLQLGNLPVPAIGTEFLGEHGVGCFDILGFNSAVGDADAEIAGWGWMMIEISAESLYRK